MQLAVFLLYVCRAYTFSLTHVPSPHISFSMFSFSPSLNSTYANNTNPQTHTPCLYAHRTATFFVNMPPTLPDFLFFSLSFSQPLLTQHPSTGSRSLSPDIRPFLTKTTSFASLCLCLFRPLPLFLMHIESQSSLPPSLSISLHIHTHVHIYIYITYIGKNANR